MRDTKTIDQLMTRAMDVVNQLKTCGENFTNQKVVEKIIRILPPSFDIFVIAIEESKDLSHFSILPPSFDIFVMAIEESKDLSHFSNEEKARSMLNHELRIKSRNVSLKMAFQTQAIISRGR